MGIPNYKTASEQTVLCINSSEGERLKDLYVWSSSKDDIQNGCPRLTTLSSKQYSDGKYDMKIVFHHKPGAEMSVYSWAGMSQSEYEDVLGETVEEFGSEGLEKLVFEGEDQRTGDYRRWF